ncbi:MAG: GNAT family N-acetyltransferase [Polaromonas sp.]|uniref:GNAT family N-acetyltransferase n=1 Tax=Polaromonas sp. TaxID=1869339 RepID=UPI003263355D
MHIRPYTPSDAVAIAQLFTDAVHGLAASHYDAVQREAWAPRPPDFDQWKARLEPLQILVAQEERKGEGALLLGFVGYETNGHIDLLFTSPAAARQGVASQLYGRAETALSALGVQRCFTEASLVSRLFFERQGYGVQEEQCVERRGALLRRFAMTKMLGSGV